MAFVTPAHVRQLAEAEFSDLPVLAVDVDGEIAIFPQCTATERGARILTDAAALHEYAGGELDDTLAAQFAAEINEAHGLGEGSEDTDDETGENPMRRIVNLTPHNVTLVTASGDEVVVQPEATPARIPTTTTPVGDVNGIPLVEERLGDADDVLPAPQPGVVYVVARPVAERAGHRTDLLVPTQVERVNGRPVRARALARVMAASPRTTAADALVRVAETAIEDKDHRGALELLELAAQIRRGSVPALRDGVRQLSGLEQMQFISAQLRAETRAALETLRGIESAYVADVQDNPPSCRPCGGYGELPVDDVTPPTPCSECGGTGREVVVPTA